MTFICYTLRSLRNTSSFVIACLNNFTSRNNCLCTFRRFSSNVGCLSSDYGRSLAMLGGASMLGSSLNTKNDSEQWASERHLIHQIAIAELALKDGDLDKAREALESAISQAEKAKVLVGLPTAYDMLATIAFQQGDLKQAKQLLINAINSLVNLGLPKTDDLIVNFNLKLARVFSALDEDQLAEASFRDCLATQLQKMKQLESIDSEIGLLCVTIMFWYGKFLLDKRRFDEARNCLDKSYTLGAQVHSIQPGQLMVILYHMSRIAFKKKDYDGALKHLINAVAIGRDIKNPDLPYYYVLIGRTYLQRGIFDQAKLWCSSAKRSARSFRNKDAEREAIDCLSKI